MNSQPFDFSTVKDFDNHIGGSIAGYDLLDQLISQLSTFFVRKEGTIVDLGCTTGRMLSEVAKAAPAAGSLLGFDIVSEQFTPIEDSRVSLIQQDITDPSFVIPGNSLTLSVFTLQFIAPEHRPRIISQVWDSLEEGGAFILCEKEYGNSSRSHEAFTFSNYNYKRAAFSPEEILDKEKALRSVMTPLTANVNRRYIDAAPWASVDTFFASLNFKGYLCLK